MAKNAHENIDNLIVLNTLNEIAHGRGQFGIGGQILYGAETEGGDPRYILRESSSLPTKDLREVYGHNLREQIRRNPEFADTLSASQVPGLLKGMQEQDRPSILSRLIDRIKGLF